MDSRIRRRTGLTGVGLILGAMIAGVPLAAQEVAIPNGITVEQVGTGLLLYHGKGACQVCHGDLGVGTGDGPSLVTGAWKLGPGTFDWLRDMTRHAGWGAKSPADDPQPMRGPTVLDPVEVAAVAAYVWNISRGRTIGAARQP
jgi:mono/diheme cytochrome c family protein